MARPTAGFRVRPHAVTGIYQVRFTLAGAQREFTTGERDPGRAAKEGARKYAEAISGRWNPDAPGSIAPGTPLDEVAAIWLAAITSSLDPKTIAQYKMYVATHWTPFFGSLDRVLTPSTVDYSRKRLGEVRRKTLQKELSALRGFLNFCEDAPINNSPIYVPPPPRNATGVTSTKHPHKVAPVELEPARVEKILAALPEWSAGSRSKPPFPVRARFIVAWQTGLRPATLDELSAPEDYRKRARRLKLRDEIDKARFGRTLPLTREARAALDSVIRGPGPIFGCHDYRDYLKAAGKAAGLRGDDAKHFSPYDLRHARGTHLTEASGGNLNGVAYLLGHRQVTTTNRYVHPSLKAAERVLAAGRQS
jgi:integrase